MPVITKPPSRARRRRMEPWPAGTTVRLVGLAKAPQHNGKTGRVSARPAKEGRVGVVLGDGISLAVRRENLELVPPKSSDAQDQSGGVERTLKRDSNVLIEFHGSPDPDLMVLYHHLRDRDFDCFNASEYHTQMEHYYAKGLSVVAVVPRQIADGGYMLVCLRHQVEDRNTLCELAFQCMRQFCGVSLLVKKRCFVCHKPGAAACEVCQCACFCSPACAAAGRSAHGKLCELVRGSAVVGTEEEALQLL